MASYRKRALALAAVASMSVVGLTACGGGSNASGGKGGGTLTYYVRSVYEHTDPQRSYLGVEMTNWSRLVYRSLVAFPISDDPTTATTPVPDLATTTGTSTNSGKTWSFTLKDGIKWQDGQPITCADFKYGASRDFATDVITGGPNYILTYLDIPTDPKTQLPLYTGPYKNTPAGVAAFDKAITCNGNTITYNFKKAWPDFPEAIAALHMMDPYRKDKDQGDKSNYQIFSNGPYELDGTTQWKAQTGGTFVRNPNYDPKTDSTDIRKALPNKIIFKVGNTSEVITDLINADSGANQGAVTQQSIPSSKYAEVINNKNTVSVKSPYVDYLVLNFKRMTNLKVRQALAASTNDTAWVAAGGGPKAYDPATDIVSPSVKGYQPNLFPGGAGDVAKASALLKSAGVPLPYPINFTYPSTPTADAQARALQQTWEAAGFKVTLQGVANQDAYYTNIQSPSQTADVIWAGWGADWPSAITVTAPLFDSRPNLTPSSNGQDYGAYKSTAFEALVDKAQAATSLDDQTKFLQQADQLLANDVAYIPVDIPIFYMIHGSKVLNYDTTAASNSYPDLGGIDVSSSVQ